MKKNLFLFFGLLSAIAFGQYEVTIDAQLLNKETKEPVEFANVRFLDKNVGTVSHTDGKFFLQFDESWVGELGILQITALGYETRQITLRQLYTLLEKQNIIDMVPSDDQASKGISRTEIDSSGNVSGTITNASGPLQGARVKAKNTYKEVITDADGKFQIDVAPGTLLEVEHLGSISKQLTAASTMDIQLEVDGELLEEVYLDNDKLSDLSDRKIVTAYGKKDFDKLGYTAYQVSGDEILPSYQDLSQIMAKFPGVVFNSDPNNRIYAFSRSLASSINGNTLPVIVIDEIPYTQGENSPIPAIDVQNIHSVTTLPGLAGSIKYGTLARGGAIIIRTKSYAFAQGDFGGGKRPTGALIEGNDFNEILRKYDAKRIQPAYISQLNSAESFLDAKRVYNSQKTQRSQFGIPYYINTSSYFQKWNNDYAAKVLEGIANEAPTNVRALRTMAYHLESLSKYEEAKNAYQRIALLRPKEAQSYRDLAHIYKETGEITKAFGLYKQILANETPGVNFQGIQKAAENELQQLIKNHKAKVDFSDLPNDLLDVRFKHDVRVVLEWNDPTTEFEIQFVNPRGKYFTWRHDLFSNKERLLEEVEEGYSMEEFIIDDSSRGPWQVNLRFNGSEAPSKNPTFLKYTRYKDYGLSTETKETKVVKLYQYNEKVVLDKFNY